jgi:phage tail-like protein
MKRKRLILAFLIVSIFLLIGSSSLAFAPVAEKKDPLPSSNFIVEIDGIATASFIYVEGVGSNMEVVEYRAGNEQNEVHNMPGLSRAGPITLKRYLDDNNELWEWFKNNRDDTADYRSMSIVIMDRGRNEQVRYNFHDCWPSEYYIEPLESNPSDVAVEVIVIQCDSMERAE